MLDNVFINRLFEHLFKVCLVSLGADKLYASVAQGLVKVAAYKVVEDIDPAHLIGDSRRVLRRKLSAVGPIDLIAVIFLGVVRSGYVETRGRALLADGKAKLGGRSQRVENAHMDAVCSHNAGSFPCKQLAVVAAVKAYGYSL